jgi:hypothetical protein
MHRKPNGIRRTRSIHGPAWRPFRICYRSQSGHPSGRNHGFYAAGEPHTREALPISRPGVTYEPEVQPNPVEGVARCLSREGALAGLRGRCREQVTLWSGVTGLLPLVKR